MRVGAQTDVDDRSWSDRFGRPGVDGPVSALALYGGQIVAAGQFSISADTRLCGMARWDGQAWRPLGSGAPGCRGWVDVRAATEYAGELVVVGSFATRFGAPGNGIAAWDGAAWHALGSGLAGPEGYTASGQCVAVFGGDLVVGGSFGQAGGVPARNLARWNGSLWAPLGEGAPGPVDAVAVVAGELYAAWSVYHEEAGTEAAVLHWNGSSWEQVGARFDGPLYALGVHDGNLVVGGIFWSAGGVSLSCIASWNGSAWSSLGGGIGTPGEFQTVNALATFAGDLVAAGNFARAGTVEAAGIARWDGASWKALGSGLRGAEFGSGGQALLVQDGELIVGGTFGRAGGVPANYAARWNGTSWSALGTPGLGIDGTVGDMLEHDGALVVAGRLEQAGDVPVRNVARWDGHAWSAMDAGLPPTGDVSALVVYADQLHAALTRGEFDSTRSQVFHWNGASWSPLGPAAAGRIECAAVYRDELVVGGDFSQFGSTPAAGIARWDGTSWHELGSGVSGGVFLPEVRALAIDHGVLVAGGSFDTAGGVRCFNIARWDGASWRSFGSGIPFPPGSFDRLNDLIPYRNGVVAIGSFAHAGGATVNGIAYWDGAIWNPLATGLHLGSGSGTGIAGLANGRILFIVGGFESAGNAPALDIARWDGASWSALGSGIGDVPDCLAMFQGDLYVGGSFTAAGGKQCESIARWSNPNVPVEVTDLAAAAEPERVRLSWSLSEPDRVAGVHVERAEDEAGPYVRRTLASLEPGPRMEFTDSETLAGRTYWYRLWLENPSGAGTWAGPVQVQAGSLPQRTFLYPPVETSAGVPIALRYEIATPGTCVRLGVYDVRGRQIWSMPAGVQSAGSHVRMWTRVSSTGAPAPHGVYLVRLDAGAVTSTRKLVLLRP